MVSMFDPSIGFGAERFSGLSRTLERRFLRLMVVVVSGMVFGSSLVCLVFDARR